MFTVEKAKKLLDLCLNEYTSLKDEEIEILEGGKFSVNINTLVSKITIEKESNQDVFYKNIGSYLLKTFDLDYNSFMFYNFVECFSFLHEVGHIYYNYIVPEDEELLYYSNYKEKIYSSHKSAFEEYRNIPTENNADSFAVTMLNNQKLNIWAIMQDISLEKAQEELEFWNM